MKHAGELKPCKQPIKTVKYTLLCIARLPVQGY